jgi:hypothetical protein
MDKPASEHRGDQPELTGIKSRILQQIASEVETSRLEAASKFGKGKVLYAKNSYLKTHYTKGKPKPKK